MRPQTYSLILRGVEKRFKKFRVHTSSKKSEGDPDLDPIQEIPENDRAEDRRGETETGVAHIIEIKRNNSPKEKIHDRPVKDVEYPLLVAEKEKHLPEENRVDTGNHLK